MKLKALKYVFDFASEVHLIVESKADTASFDKGDTFARSGKLVMMYYITGKFFF